MKALTTLLILQLVFIVLHIVGLVSLMIALLPIVAAVLFSLTVFIIALIKYARKGVSGDDRSRVV